MSHTFTNTVLFSLIQLFLFSFTSSTNKSPINCESITDKDECTAANDSPYYKTCFTPDNDTCITYVCGFSRTEEACTNTGSFFDCEWYEISLISTNYSVCYSTCPLNIEVVFVIDTSASFIDGGDRTDLWQDTRDYINQIINYWWLIQQMKSKNITFALITYASRITVQFDLYQYSNDLSNYTSLLADIFRPSLYDQSFTNTTYALLKAIEIFRNSPNLKQDDGSVDYTVDRYIYLVSDGPTDTFSHVSQLPCTSDQNLTLISAFDELGITLSASLMSGSVYPELKTNWGFTCLDTNPELKFLSAYEETQVLEFDNVVFLSSHSCLPLETSDPTIVPTVVPTLLPTVDPTFSPTFDPTFLPTIVPTFLPSVHPTLVPSLSPSTALPTFVPSVSPSSRQPSSMPSGIPTFVPSAHPFSSHPTFMPSLSPSTKQPSYGPSGSPSTRRPSFMPSMSPSTRRPSSMPSMSPSTRRPSSMPSMNPSTRPTSMAPTVVDNGVPTGYPTMVDNTPSPTLKPVTSKIWYPIKWRQIWHAPRKYWRSSSSSSSSSKSGWHRRG